MKETPHAGFPFLLLIGFRGALSTTTSKSSPL